MSATSCCINRRFNSTCFVFFPVPILVAMLLPLDESVCILMFALLLFSKSPALMAYNSASALDRAIVACVRLP